MSFAHRVLLPTLSVLIITGCAKAQTGNGPDGGPDPGGDASCGESCDEDNDGVFDLSDMCPGTPAGAVVNQVGCADSQVNPMLEPTFPPYGLTWVPTGDIGKAGGLVWTYTNIQRADLFHIIWVLCDDPMHACGLSLDGPIDMSAEGWSFSATGSDLAMGKLVLTNATRILLDDTTTPALDGRLTLTIVDASDAPVKFGPVSMFGVTARLGSHGAEIPGTGFKITAIAEVSVPGSGTWTPYADYYNAAPTPMAGGTAQISFGGSFYGE